MEVEARGPCMSDELYAGLERQLVALAGRKNAGWKVGLTSGQARDSMGAGFRPFGYILSERVFSSGAELPSPNLASWVLKTSSVFDLTAMCLGTRIGMR
ncbi:MAG: hypothetical protein Ct9H300mP8_10840 [Gammaproteobacteria bacterium]|nr:MAG: hypothetical protein Ct9H300mP8_10840 [Gammaproteobacteria bacterium]